MLFMNQIGFCTVLVIFQKYDRSIFCCFGPFVSFLRFFVNSISRFYQFSQLISHAL